MWAIGEKDAVTALRGAWQGILDNTQTGMILEADIDTVGVR